MTVRIPGPLVAFAGGAGRVVLPDAPDVGQALAALGARHPGVMARVLDERGELRPHVNVFVNGENVRFASGLDTPVPPGAEVFILPSVSGG